VSRELSAVVVGGGIGGLAAAAALGRSGVRVTVLERGDGRREPGAGLSLSPNAYRALEALGVAEEVERARRSRRRPSSVPTAGR